MNIRNEIEILRLVRQNYQSIHNLVFENAKQSGCVTVTNLNAVYIFSSNLVEYIKRKHRFVENYHHLGDFVSEFAEDYIHDFFWSHDVFFVDYNDN
jgi:hypothetical protein